MNNNDTNENQDIMSDFDPVNNLLSMSAQNQLDLEATEGKAIEKLMTYGDSPEAPTSPNDTPNDTKEALEGKEEEEELPEEILAKIEAAAAERLKPIKEKLNDAYSKRDSALNSLNQLTKTLGIEEGDIAPDKLKAIASREVIEDNKRLQQELETLRQEKEAYVVGNSINGAMSGQSFVSEEAQKMLTDLLQSRMILSEDGTVLDKETGYTPSEYLQVLKTKKSHSFLFSQTKSTGAAITPNSGQAPQVKKSITEMSFSEWSNSADGRNAGKNQIF